jgi:uncharacterized protein (DUF362 family)
MPNPIKKVLFIYCPKSGRIVGINWSQGLLWCLYPVVGLFALVWILIRVIPKPSRANYPCIRAATPLAFSFLGYVLSLGVAAFFVRRAAKAFSKYKLFLAINCLVIATVGLVMSLDFPARESQASFVPSDAPNQPIGTAYGIFPGRVVWINDPNATAWDGINGSWRSDEYTDPTVIKNMLSHSLQWLTEQEEDNLAWDLLFRYYNKKVNNTDIGYQNGEKIAIKVNVNNYGKDNKIDASPQLIYNLLSQLVNKAGIPQSAITVYDAIRPVTSIYNRCYTEFPQVNYNLNIEWVSNTISYSSQITDETVRSLPKCVLEAKYIINMAILKRHNLRAAVTLCGKNNFGSIANPAALHPYVISWTKGMGSYDPQVDLMGSEKLGAKTLLYIIDGLYGASEWDAVPSKWSSAPFNGDWPSSIFVSQDPVAIDSVGVDFLRTEWSLQDYADNYLHEAAMAENPTSGVVYDPEADGVRMKSLGVHEHWNNSIDKQYSRSLGTGNGIELIYVSPQMNNYRLFGDFNSDGVVNEKDIKLLSNQWLTRQGDENWNLYYDIVPIGGDGIIDIQEFTAVSLNWMHTDCGAYFAADFNRDCRVDMEDLTLLASAWLTEPGQPEWNSHCDILPVGGDEKIDIMDFTGLSHDWMLAL